ncbi:FMN-binding protein [Alienimonas sp. DA493]|uniref:FMN-binding protein n=1 Tax=Alienimonas sp. DA493 TaxID=3373605 RepID=UPI0037547B74
MSDPAPPNPSRRWRRRVLHAVRLGLFATVVGLIASVPAGSIEDAAGDGSGDGLPPAARAAAATLFPAAAAFGEPDAATGAVPVLDAAGERLGFLLKTMPDSRRIVGFSGPSDLLIAFEEGDGDAVIRGVSILRSGDTDEHVAAVREADVLNGRFVGKTWSEAASAPPPDAVSGATLTARAMWQSIRVRLDGNAPIVPRFEEVLTVEKAQTLFPDAAAIALAEGVGRFTVSNAAGEPLGSLLRTSPAADGVIGYQGPTEAFVGFNAEDQKAVGLIVDDTFDNEPYVTYLREDEWGFLRLFDGMTVEELAARGPADGGYDAVSGATMTSLAVVDGAILAAKADLAAAEPTAAPPPTDGGSPSAWDALTWRNVDWGMLALVAGAVLVGFTRLRGFKAVRWAWLALLIGYLGVWRGDLLSQAMWVGWAEHGVPWRTASGLALLTAAALSLPVVTKRNVYCTHLCPHGAVQQAFVGGVFGQRLKPRRSVGRGARRALALLPPALLALVLLAAFGFPLVAPVALEPFDAWHWSLAGLATKTIFVVGLIAALFVPMAYCRHGCPTGALLEYLRANARSDRWTARDWVAVALTAFAAGLRFLA